MRIITIALLAYRLIAVLLTFFRETYVPRRMAGCSPQSVAIYNQQIRHFSSWIGRDAVLTDLNDTTVAAYIAAVSPGHSPATINSRLSILKAIANFAAKQHLCEWVTVKGPKNYRRVPKARTADEVTHLLEFCDTLPGKFGPVPACLGWKALFSAVYDTAVRISAMLSLRQIDVDLARLWVFIRAERQKQRADQMLRISEATADYLAAIWLPERELVWPLTCSRATFYRQADRIFAGAGLPHDGKSKFHCLRRTSLSYTAKAYGRAAACDKAGHSSMAMTDRYLDPTIVGQANTPPPLRVSSRPILKIYAG